MNPQLAIAVALGLVASVEDLARRRVSNWISITALGAGFCCLGWERGWRGVLSALCGSAAGFAVFVILYRLGGMGGGDVKLMAGLGAVLGWERLPAAVLCTAVCGGLLAVLWLGTARLACGQAGSRIEAIPYAPAIAVGSWLALLG